MNIYDAIMKTADHIERSPQDFQFSCIFVPAECGSPGCALGWIGHFSGMSGSYAKVSRELLNLPESESTHGLKGTEFTFYNRLTELNNDSTSWMGSAATCATVLRLYAAKYHAPTKAAVLRTDSELVADLLRKITTERIPEDVC